MVCSAVFSQAHHVRTQMEAASRNANLGIPIIHNVLTMSILLILVCSCSAQVVSGCHPVADGGRELA